jgi:hypothetical protein
MSRGAPAAFVGTWRITDMEVWSREAFDLLGPACFKIDRDAMGRLRFIAVEGDLDCRFSERDGEPMLGDSEAVVQRDGLRRKGDVEHDIVAPQSPEENYATPVRR